VGRGGEKPRLRDAGDLRFNMSHAEDLCLVAVARGREVGVDLEAVRPLGDLAVLAETCFSPMELEALLAVPESGRVHAFYSGWTRKEAVLKALGDGLARPLDSFDVTLAPGEPARLLQVDGDPTASARYELHALEPWPGFVGALAVEGRGGRLRLLDWTGFGYFEEEGDGQRGEGTLDDIRGRREPRGAVLDLARGQGDPQGLAGRGQERAEGRVP
jgi:4'-phosphopantetheinyl transferase